MTKKAVLYLALILAACFLGAAAPNGRAATAAKGLVHVAASLPLAGNIAVKIGGARVTVKNLIQGSACDHSCEPGAGAMRELAGCDVFVKIGMGSDPWADRLARGVLGKKALFIDSSKGIKSLRVDNLVNPHYWGNPDNVKIMARNILEGLCAAAPGDKAFFTGNYLKFIREIDRTSATLKAESKQAAGKQFVSYSNAFPYFYQYFGFRNLKTVELVCEQGISPRDLADAIRLMKAKRIKVVVGDAAEPRGPAEFARETGARLVLLWPTTDASGDYLRTLRRNVKTLVAALTQASAR